MTRREFLQVFGSSALMSAGGCRTGLTGTKPRYALQLYSVHQIFWQDPVRHLAALKAGGYDGVEFAGYNGKTAAELRRLLADAGLAAAGTHVNGDVALVGDELKRTLDFCAEAGIESVTTPHAQRRTEAAYRQFGHEMGRAAEAAARYGIKVGIHSTYHHFTTRYRGVSAWDVIYSEASPLLQQQIDTGNTFHTGEDLVALLKKYRDRHHSIHAKENVPTVDGVLGVPPTDGGKCVPWDEVLAYMKTEATHGWWIVEAEGRPDSLEPALKCLAYLKKRT
jgi:sugar phosphate isomerase/epimerase